MNLALIGTRNLSPEQVEILANKGLQLANSNNCILSGNALGADQAWVSKLTIGQYVLYLPWVNYERQARPVGASYDVVNEEYRTLTEPYWNEYAELTKKAPWDKLKFGTKSLQARNLMMITDCCEVYATPGWDSVIDNATPYGPTEYLTPTGGTAFGIFLAGKMGKKCHLLRWNELTNDYQIL